MSKLTKIYGIKFMADVEHSEKVNDYLKEKGSKLLYLPFKFRMNIYFTKAADAAKVSQYYNAKQNGRNYHIFPTSLESLKRVKDIYENDKSLQKRNPTMHHKLTGFRVYNSAEEYFKLLEENNTLVDEDEVLK